MNSVCYCRITSNPASHRFDCLVIACFYWLTRDNTSWGPSDYGADRFSAPECKSYRAARNHSFPSFPIWERLADFLLLVDRTKGGVWSHVPTHDAYPIGLIGLWHGYGATKDILCGGTSGLSASSVGNEKLPQLPQARGGRSGQEQQERMHVNESQVAGSNPTASKFSLRHMKKFLGLWRSPYKLFLSFSTCPWFD